jgi:pimeloyl-ACP methyl ester carboxylesterase
MTDVLNLPSGRTGHLVAGPVEGPTVVFVPGATLPMFVWDDLAASLASSGFRTIRYDLLGRGGSAAPRIRYDAELFDRQLTELLDVLEDGRPVHLVSLAFGALISAGFAERHPARVRSLTYVAPDGFGVELSPAARMLLRPVVGEALLGLAGTRILLSRLADYSDRVEVVEQLRTRFRPYVSAPGYQRAVLSSVRNMPIHDAEALYRHNRAIPTLVLWGRDDRVTPLPRPEALAAAMPAARVQIFDATGHLPQVERLTETAAALRSFWSDIVSDPKIGT